MFNFFFLGALSPWSPGDQGHVVGAAQLQHHVDQKDHQLNDHHLKDHLVFVDGGQQHVDHKNHHLGYVGGVQQHASKQEDKISWLVFVNIDIL